MNSSMKKILYVLLIVCTIINVVSIITGYNYDSKIFFQSYISYIENGNPFLNYQFVYLIHFMFLYFVYYINYIFTLIINLFCLYYIITQENKFNNVNNLYWLICCYLSIIYTFWAGNIDLIIVALYIFYYRNREKSYSLLILFLTLVKPTAIITMLLIEAIILFEKKKIDFKRYIFIGIIGIFIFILFYISIQMGLLENTEIMNEFYIETTNITVFFRYSHVIWLLYPLKIYLDKVKNSKKLKIIWLILFAAITIYMIFITVFTINYYISG